MVDIVKRLRNGMGDPFEHVIEAADYIERLRDEVDFQLHKRKEAADDIERLREALHHISLCSQNSMSSKDECGKIARAALKEKE